MHTRQPMSVTKKANGGRERGRTRQMRARQTKTKRAAKQATGVCSNASNEGKGARTFEKRAFMPEAVTKRRKRTEFWGIW